MKQDSNIAARAGILLGVFSLLTMLLIALVYLGLRHAIDNNERLELSRQLQILAPATSHDNDLLSDALEIKDSLLGQKPAVIYRARLNQRPVMALLRVISPDGYGGDISLLIAIGADGAVVGVRVLQHRETPGFGDALDADPSPWILKFSGLSLNHPEERLWRVKRDGGVFDQFTGATVTPRAVVKAVRDALRFFRDKQEMLFALK